MTQAQFPYHLQLDAQKAVLFAKCFQHCIECEGITFDTKEQSALIGFIARVDQKASVEAWVERVAGKQIVEDAEETHAPEPSPWPNIEDAPDDELNEFIYNFGPIEGYPWQPTEHNRMMVEAAQAELARRSEPSD
jgi:hypothetical protein